MSPLPGSYIIRPKVSEDDALILGPIPRSFPPPDVSVKIGDRALVSFLFPLMNVFEPSISRKLGAWFQKKAIPSQSGR